MTGGITVVVAEDHPVFRKGLTDVLAEDPAFRIVAEAGDGERALQLVWTHQPDIVVLDIEMPKASGLEVAETIVREELPTAVVMLTMYREAALLRRALDIGVRGYVLKDSAVTDIVACLNMVAAGRTYVSGPLADARERGPGAAAPVPGLDRLTPAERRILRRVADGLTSTEIAGALAISPKTVDNHRSRICRKLGLTGPQALLRFALEHKATLE